jgi:uncharacterized protein
MPLPTPSPTGTAVVTGASSGIGADIARELADRGHGVTLVARREDRLRELADELAGRVRVEVIACDVADSAARAGLLDEVDRRGLTADILVNNAGIGTIGSVTKTLVDDEIAQVRVNVEAVIDLTTRAVQQMVPRRRGAILNLGSTAGYHPFPGQLGYAATDSINVRSAGFHRASSVPPVTSASHSSSLTPAMGPQNAACPPHSYSQPRRAQMRRIAIVRVRGGKSAAT